MSGTRGYARPRDKLTDEVKNFGLYDEVLHLERVIKTRLEEGWTEEEIVEKYKRNAMSMVFPK